MISSRTEQYTEFAGKHWVELYERLLLWTTNAPEFAYQQQDSPRFKQAHKKSSWLRFLLPVSRKRDRHRPLPLLSFPARRCRRNFEEASQDFFLSFSLSPSPPLLPVSTRSSPLRFVFDPGLRCRRGQCEDARPAFVMPHGSRPRWVSVSRVPVFDLSGDDDSLSAVSGG
ncbi:hypothetical protein BHE74_00026269 [Ensete ventricosum]|nr:hypothetical protein BHE74_00026269 [Ensete ventricosum]